MSDHLDGLVVVRSPLVGTVVATSVALGDSVDAGATMVILESMKMEHVVTAPVAGTVAQLEVGPGEVVAADQVLVTLHPQGDQAEVDAGPDRAVDLELIRGDLAELFRRRGLLADEARPDVVAARHERGRRTARETLADLCDPGSFIEYGGFAIAAQRRRRPLEELIARTPADGLIGGTARVNGEHFDDARARCAVVSYDYTVLAGTQGQVNHRKKDRLFALAERLRLPVVLFAEGGGGRPGDTDTATITGLDTEAFALFGRLSGLVPLVGIASGYCFAGNAALLGCCDVIIATKGSSIGMGGPAMIEGGGLGTFHPSEVGPTELHVSSGVVDLLAEDDTHAVALAKQYLSYFQGVLPSWSCADQRLLRHDVPEARQRAYDIRSVIDHLCDTGSVLELRKEFGAGIVTALVRIEGRPLGLVANDPLWLGGAIDADGADKMARFLQLCDAHDLPVVTLCDTPGFMVGPETEATGQVRHVSRLFVIGASLTVPVMTVVLRKGYGLGAQAMAGGSFRAPIFLAAWPSGELGGMGLEGAVRLGFRKELEAVVDPEEREELFSSMVALAYEHGRALNVASAYEIDDVIDPAETRTRIVEALRASPPPPPRTGKKRSCIDTW